MQTTRFQPEPIQFPPDFDDVLGDLYGLVRPEDVNEVACNLAGLMDEYDTTVVEMERVLVNNNLIELTPENARRFATEAIHLSLAGAGEAEHNG